MEKINKRWCAGKSTASLLAQTHKQLDDVEVTSAATPRRGSLPCKRRDFLKNGAGAFAIAAAGTVRGANAPSNRVRLGIVACARYCRGQRVLGHTLKVPGVEIAYACDVLEEARNWTAGRLEKETGVRPKKEKDVRKVLEDKELDGIICATPDHWHATCAVMAMRAGKHVYVEKPCAFCPSEGEIIMATQKATGKVFQMGNQRRSSEYVRKAVKLIHEGAIGETKWGKVWYMAGREPIGNGKSVPVPKNFDWDLWQGPAPRTGYRDNYVPYNWHWFRRWGTGECGNNSIHFVDLARWAMKLEWPSRVTSSGGEFWIPESDDWQWPDAQMVTWEFPERKFITWEGLCCTGFKPYMGYGTGAMIYGTKGTAFFTPGSGVIIDDGHGKNVRKFEPEGADKVKDTTDRVNGGGITDPTFYHVSNFVDAVRKNDPAFAYSGAEDAVKSTFLALSANVSQLSRSVIDVDPSNGGLRTKAGEAFWSREYEKGWELA